MVSSNQYSVRSVCNQYGPGRLPKADRDDIGAGYAGATAAFVATVVYAGSMVLGDLLGFGVEWPINVFFAAVALPFVVPAAFLVGAVSWRVLPSSTTLTGVVAGGVGTIATYLLTVVSLGTILTIAAALSVSGADVSSAVGFSWGLGYTAFIFTSWVTIPIGCLAGGVYANATSTSE